MKISVNKVHFPVTTLGYGRRLGIWVQGCSIKCVGCLSRDTWQRNPECDIDIDEFLESCGRWIRVCDGVTISGGEPFDQPEALGYLLSGLRKVCRGDILAYSGYPKSVLLNRQESIIKNMDVLISGPYLQNKSNSLVLRGSDNQHIVLLTPLARRRYPRNIDKLRWDKQRKLDIVIAGNSAWMAGIPFNGGIENLRKRLKSMGFNSRTSDEDNTSVS